MRGELKATAHRSLPIPVYFMDSERVNKDQPRGGKADERARARNCPACGTEARRAKARFCSTCGRALEDSYLPADALRASYHLQHRPVTGRKGKGTRAKIQMSSTFSSGSGNSVATTALAFMTYSLVPYLGILFSPGALILGVIGLAYSVRMPEKGGRQASYASVICGLLILGVQILLWWIIIKAPEWTKPF
jgi:hypothetical protein